MKVLNFGSLNIDMVYNVDNFVHPGETISSLKMEKFCGGKGLNQSLALARAGAEVYHAGCIGPDGGMLTEILKSSKANTEYIKMVDTPTGHAIIQVDNKGQNCIILYGGANMEVTTQYVDTVLNNFNKDDIILLQNEISSLSYIIDKAYERGMKIALNPSPINENIIKASLDKVSYFILNEIEGREITGRTKAEDIIEGFKKKYPKAKIVLTLGENGVIYFDGETKYRHGIYAVDVIDTTAAGDTFTGYFLAGIIRGQQPMEILKTASMASALAVSVKGAANSIPDLNTVKKSLIENATI